MLTRMAWPSPTGFGLKLRKEFVLIEKSGVVPDGIGSEPPSCQFV